MSDYEDELKERIAELEAELAAFKNSRDWQKERRQKAKAEVERVHRTTSICEVCCTSSWEPSPIDDGFRCGYCHLMGEIEALMKGRGGRERGSQRVNGVSPSPGQVSSPLPPEAAANPAARKERDDG